MACYKNNTDSILQGTTPQLAIEIDPEDFAVSDVTALELRLKHRGKVTIYSLDNVEVDTETNTFIKTFTEEETMALSPKNSIVGQCRFWFRDGGVVGTNKFVLNVDELQKED
jgi:hypothetical protein